MIGMNGGVGVTRLVCRCSTGNGGVTYLRFAGPGPRREGVGLPVVRVMLDAARLETHEEHAVGRVRTWGDGRDQSFR